MKLMSVPRLFAIDNIFVDKHHRVALGLETGTQVHLVALPRREGSRRHSELLATVFAPRQWAHLWRLSIELPEVAGVVETVLDVIRSGINISILETVTTEAGGVHSFLAVVDLSTYPEAKAAHFETTALAGDVGQNTLLKKLVDCISRFTGREQSVRMQLRPMRRLREASKRCTDADLLRFALPCAMEENCIRPPTEQEVRRLVLGGAGQGASAGLLPTRVMMFSDTEEKYLCMYFPEEIDCLLTATVVHQDAPGAIHSFAGSLRAVGANILSSYSRLQRSGDKAQWKFTVEVPPLASCRALVEGLETSSTGVIAVERVSISYVEQSSARGVQDSPREKEIQICGRSVELDDVASIEGLRAGVVPGSGLVTGYYQTGKSAFLSAIEDRVRREGSQRVVVVAVNARMRSGQEFFVEILRALWRELAREGALECDGAVVDGFFAEKKFSSELGAAEDFIATKDFVVACARANDATIDVGLSRLCVRAFERVAQMLVRLNKSALVLVDEGQDVIAEAAVNREVHKVWVEVIECVKSIRWIVATSKWDAKGGASDLKGRLSRRIWLGRLTTESCHALIGDIFGKHGILVLDDASAAIGEVCNEQPHYIIELCRAIRGRIGRAPAQVDVVTAAIARASVDDAVKLLDAHFMQAAEYLRSIVGVDEVRAAVSRTTSITAARQRPEGGGVVLRSAAPVRLDCMPVVDARWLPDKLMLAPIFARWWTSGGF